MHKEEASQLYGILSNPNRVKALKMLYNKGNMNFNTLSEIMKLEENTLKMELNTLIDSKLVVKENDLFKCNEPLVLELMNFIMTPCGCTHK